MGSTSPSNPPSKTSLTFFTTGSVKIKTVMYTQPASSPVLLRRLRLFTGSTYTGALPIGVFLIQHPDGPILFDTGESPCCNDAGYFPAWNVPTRTLTATTIAPADGIVAQLRAAGTDPASLRAIVLSHLHRDHAGGLAALAEAAPHVPVYVGPAHWAAFGHRPFKASIEGCAPQRWPKGFAPTILELKEQRVGPWERSYPLTEDGRVAAVDTPGHVPGHVSLVVRGEGEDGGQTTYLLTGDATYGLDLLEQEETDGVNDDPMTALASVRLMKEFARQEDVIVLPSHDPDTPRLLRERVVYRPGGQKMS